MAIVGARLAFNYAFSGTASRLAQQRGQTAAHRDGRKLLEEVWVLGGNILMLSIAGFVMAFHNGGCWFGNVRPCLAGWPNHSSDISTTLYYSLELAWYGHLLLKPVFNYGLADGRDMMLHHCASLALLIASCGLNLTRMGIVVLTLFGMSNCFACCENSESTPHGKDPNAAFWSLRSHVCHYASNSRASYCLNTCYSAL